MSLDALHAAAPPGSLVAFWDEHTLALGVVAGEEKQRIRLIVRRGQAVRVQPARILLQVEPAGAIPGGGSDDARQAGQRVERATERIRTLAERIEVALLWDILSESEGEEPLALSEIAQLAVASSAGSAQAAVALALIEDGIHFVRRGEAWQRRSVQAVAELRHQRERVATREAETRAFHQALSGLAAGAAYESAGGEVERRAREALEQLALQQDATPEPARVAALEALAASGLRWDRPHEGAFELLRRMGRFASEHENLQILRFELRTVWPPDVLEHADAAAAAGFERAGRADLTGLTMLTIDSASTLEIDDGLTLEPSGPDRVRLGVHIADPASFVRPGDPVDREALARSITHYFPDLRLTMLPPAIAENAASLVLGQARPALSFLIELDEAGEIRGYEILRSIVRAGARLDYGEADRRIAEAAGEHAELLAALDRVAARRERARIDSGAIPIYAPEIDLHVAADGRLSLERLEPDSAARRLVSEAMIAAGDVAARFCIAEGLPAIYRRQGSPVTLVDAPREAVRDAVLARRLRRTLKRAETGLEPGRHASLGLAAYAQVSSPLRRYQDLATHRLISAHLLGEPAPYDREAMQRIAATTEQAEASARLAERAAHEYWTLQWLAERQGELLEASVVELEPRTIVQLCQTLLEHPVPGLSGAVLGDRLQLRIERVRPRAGLLTLRPIS